MNKYGLIGKTLKHSFSKGYFTDKFESEKILDCQYELYELDHIDDFPNLIKRENLIGLNVTIPYKQVVLKFIDEFDESAEKVGAVNVIKNDNGKLIGYNSDYYGFLESLIGWWPEIKSICPSALVLGTGGASKAIIAVLKDLSIPFKMVSRNNVGKDIVTYEDLVITSGTISSSLLIINTTPLGMFPSIHDAPNIVYEEIGNQHHLYDLVYNPETTLFMSKGMENGARIKNGLQMLHLQAEKSWEIWNS